MGDPGADHDLLFGMLALRMGFIDRDRLGLAMIARIGRRGEPTAR